MRGPDQGNGADEGDNRIRHCVLVSTFSKGAKMKKRMENLSYKLMAGENLLCGLKSLVCLTDSRRTDNHIINIF